MLFRSISEGVPADLPEAVYFMKLAHKQFEDVMSKPYLSDRSEERRVGKECRFRWSPYH